MEQNMNARERMRTICQAQDLLDRRYQFRDGDIKINADNTDMHEVAKTIIALELKRNKQAFVTEAIFKIGRRADIFVLDQMEVIEITESEKEESIERKRKDYAEIGVTLRSHKAAEIVKTWQDKFKR
jgi:hypothetical protein